MGPSKRAGIIAGIIIVSLLAIVAYAYQDRYDDARLAEIIATYIDESGLAVAVILHNADGEFTKANGHLELTIYTENGLLAYSNEYDFTKDDFITWDNPLLGKQRGVPIIINEIFPYGDYDVYVNLKTDSGSSWDSLHASFISQKHSIFP